jgi:hypothetical protein
VVNLSLRPYYPQGRAPVRNEEAEWAPQPFWTFRIRENSFPPAGIRIDDRPGRSLVSMQTALSWFHHFILLAQYMCLEIRLYSSTTAWTIYKTQECRLPHYNFVLFQRSFSALSRNLPPPASGFRHLYGVTVNTTILILTTSETRITSPAVWLIYTSHIRGRQIPTPVNKHVL